MRKPLFLGVLAATLLGAGALTAGPASAACTDPLGAPKAYALCVVGDNVDPDTVGKAERTVNDAELTYLCSNRTLYPEGCEPAGDGDKEGLCVWVVTAGGPSHGVCILASDD